MEAGPAETRAQKAARIRPELFRLLLDFDPPAQERTEAEAWLMHAKEALQTQQRAEAERLRVEEAEAERLRLIEAQRAHDRRPLRGSRFQDCCRTTRDGGGLPEGPGIPAGITHDLVLQFDLTARRMEREERLLAMHGGDVNETLCDTCEEGGGNDARFLLAHGADANYETGALTVLRRAARNGHLAVVEALLDAGGGELGRALVKGAVGGHTAVVALLLDRGADVHYANGWPLWYAARHGRLQTAMLLLDRGADPNAHPPDWSVTALTAARDYGNHEVVALLLARGAIDHAA